MSVEEKNENGNQNQDDGQQKAPPMDQGNQGDKKDENLSNDDKPIYEGIGGPIKTQEDLANYAKGLEGQLAMMNTLYKNRTENQETLGKVYSSGSLIGETEKKEWAQKILDDPVQVFNEIGDRVSQAVQTHDKQKESLQKFWNDFYAENSALAAHKNVVDIIMRNDYKEIEHLPLGEAKKAIAKKTHALIDQIKGQNGTKETLSSGGTDNLKGFNPGGKTQDPPQEEKTFAQEFKEFKMKKKGYA